MNSLLSLPQNDVKADWLMFMVMLLAIGVAVSLVILWMAVYRPKKKKRKLKHRHHRHHNPTLAETGGLPPMRDHNQPPPGP
jgi:hypothetical protein